ncbi:hypothetical protein ACFO26_09470 [Lactococcus nasutitermitis]|uniref:Uncharacterized protein n=1 Tax=Lactococcus nasutitermitis TaxID=1652957 RepID=A0ABV9JEH8_9LACT|nr:hypothetical protein [Lactococcus nasutitermitis]
MHEQEIIDRILTDNGRNLDSLAGALSYLLRYEKINTVKFDRTGKTPDETVSEILQLYQI